MVRGIVRVGDHALGPHQAAVVRIGFAFTWLVFLLFEWPNRRELYGPNGPWSRELAERLIDTNHAFTALLWFDGTVWFEVVYALALLSAAALLVGWHTRATSVLFMIGVLSLQNHSVFMGDGGDNVIHLMALYLVFTRCGLVWSLDARRARRSPAAAGGSGADPTGVVLWSVLGAVLLLVTVRGELSWFGDDGPVLHVGWATVLWGLWLVYGLWWYVSRPGAGADADTDAGADPGAAGRPAGGRRAAVRGLMDILGNIVHNATLLVIMAEVCLIYATAGWYKIQGSRWQDGTAVYYPMHLDYFAPWPALSELLGSSGLMIMVLSYGTVIVQVAFPFTLFNRRVKNVLLVMMMVEHAGIAVILGLPFFSLAMIAADAVFLPTVFLVWAGARASGAAGRIRGLMGRRGTHQESDGGEGAERSDTGDPTRTLVG
ncbi:HTTM domain-containing protein [Streptomyces sp. TRM43335]|uniref:HTTM domain-containing protein n=1 Tax=Streptomyces taklimakanensis TaxID=2569853 RepID=A0A6G2BCF1_9ACTN|nr:HTTM domain-containing protein [Streptomyces taklimakanensis]